MAKRLAVRRKTAIHRKSVYAELSTQKPIRFSPRNTIEDNVQSKVNRAEDRRYGTLTSRSSERQRELERTSQHSITKVKTSFFFFSAIKRLVAFHRGNFSELKLLDVDRFTEMNKLFFPTVFLTKIKSIGKKRYPIDK